MYLVGVNHAAGQVKLVRYETKDSWNGRSSANHDEQHPEK